VETRTQTVAVRAGAPTVRATPAWLREWAEAEAAERAEAARIPQPPARWIAAGFALGVAASIAALVPALFSLSPGYATGDTTAQVIAAVVAAAVALALVPLAAAVAARAGVARASTSGGLILFGAAALSVGAAAIHIAVANSHFEQYVPYGVFFVASGAAQLLWPLLVVFRPVRPLLLLGAVGNLLIAALWAVDRAWGLPLGPEHWSPEPIGVADTVSTVFELLLALGCVALALRPRQARTSPSPRGRAELLLVLAVGVPTVLGLLSAVGAASSFLTPSA
jgi:hypothetical protein